MFFDVKSFMRGGDTPLFMYRSLADRARGNNGFIFILFPLNVI